MTGRLRIATYNVEWFTELFDRKGRMLPGDGPSGRHDVSRAAQLDALTRVFRAIDADAIMVIEAPDDSRRRDGEASLEAFADHAGLRTRRAEVGFGNTTRQEIALLYDPDRMIVRHDPQGPISGPDGRTDAPRFDGVFRLDLDTDASPERVTWSKPPLEVALTPKGGAALRLIGVHAKSKAAYGANSRDEEIRISIANRRKQLAQCIWLRRRVDGHLAAGDPLIVLGDFNDGPGLDQYEKLFGRSSVEVVLGEDSDRRLYDPHAAASLSQPLAAPAVTSRFYLADQKRYMQALLDFIMVSEDLRARGPAWRIWHPFDDPECAGDTALQQALLTASDHFPVTLDLPPG